MKILNNIFAITFLLISATSCKTAFLKKLEQKQDCNVIQALTEVRHPYNIYYKTFDLENGKSPFEGKITYENLNFNLNSTGEPNKIDFIKVFSENDLIFLNNQFADQKQQRLSLKCITNTGKITNKKTQKTLIASVPVYSSDGDFALVYAESLSGGEILVFKKQASGWEFFSTSLLWWE